MSIEPIAGEFGEDISDDMLQEASAAYKLSRQGLKIDGVNFDLSKLPFLWELYEEMWPKIVIRKGAQLGLTIWAILTCINRMQAGGMYQRGVLYAMPTDDDAIDFSRSRFDRILKENPSFQGLVTTTDSLSLKKVGEAMLYLRGMRSKSKLLSIPVDLIVFDEYDECDPDMVDIAMKRLDASDYAHWIKLGHPTIPSYMADLEWQKSDQRHWMIKCLRCKTYTCLEADFPDCIELNEEDFTAWRACRKCKKEIFVKDGEWVAKETSKAGIRGYWISQLLSPTVQPRDLVDDYDECMATGRGLQTFHNLRLGMPYADLDQAMTSAQVRELCDPDYVACDRHEGPTFLGADVGKKIIHACVGFRPFGERLQILNWYVLNTFDELFDLGKRFNVQTGVVDAMAETRQVRDFCKRVTWAWGSWYSRHQRSGYTWDPKAKQVTNARTESLDASHNSMIANRLYFPRSSKLFETEVVKQLINLARVIHEDPKTGQQSATWIVRGSKNDHFRHALSYAVMAASRTGMSREALRRRRAAKEHRHKHRSFDSVGWMGR